MRDNLISSLNNVLNLQGLEKLENLIFSEKDGSNPICSYETYQSFISDNLIQIRMLDNQDIQQYTQNNCYFPNEDYPMGNTYNPQVNVNPMTNNSKTARYNSNQKQKMMNLSIKT